MFKYRGIEVMINSVFISILCGNFRVGIGWRDKVCLFCFIAGFCTNLKVHLDLGMINKNDQRNKANKNPLIENKKRKKEN